MIKLLTLVLILTNIHTIKCFNNLLLNGLKIRKYQHLNKLPENNNLNLQTFNSNKCLQSRRFNGDYESNEGLPFKTVIFLSLAVIGVFGTGFLSTFKDLIVENVENPSSKTIKLKDKTLSTNSNRGAKTRMNMAEVNNKLSQIPVFYIATDKGIYVDSKDNVGLIFFDYDEALKYYESLNSNEFKLSGSTFDDVYYPLIAKKQKLGNFMSNKDVALSDPSCKYILKPSQRQISQTSDSWKEKFTTTDIPMFRVRNLAFTKPEGLEFPLFLWRDDAITSYQRLNNEKSNKADIEIQESSLTDILELFSTGGFETRSLEFYPSMDSIEKVREMISSK